MSSTIPKAILYINPKSIWSSSALLALEEKGYGDEEVETKSVDIATAENLSMSFLRINPKGTIPTLVVPLEKTLAPEDDHRYKALTDTKSILEFLDKSRSAMSHTHTTSSAPAPALAPATVALSSTAKTIIDLLHSEEADPNLLFQYNFNPQGTQPGPVKDVSFFSNRRDALVSYITASQSAQIQASEKTRKLWEDKKAFAESLIPVYATAQKDASALTPEEKQKIDEYRAKAQDLWTVKLKQVLITLDKELVGPFSLGDQISIVDLHLGPWLARVAYLCGGLASDDGDTITAKIETRVGFVLPRSFEAVTVPLTVAEDPSLEITPGAKKSKLSILWDELKIRPSWKKVYGDALH